MEKTTKEIITNPEFAIQKNAISQSIYYCTPIARKLIAMATSLLPMNLNKKELVISFSISDFLKSLNIQKGGNTHELVKNAIKEIDILKIVLKETDTYYESMSWFTYRKMDFDLNVIELEFNPRLLDLLETMKGYSKLNLIALGRLQSFYAIRYYELAISYRGFSGKKGNKKDEWFFEKTITELREMFNLQYKYKETTLFRVNIVDKPIAELNNAKVGFSIRLEYLRKGRRLLGIRFNCKEEIEKNVSPQDENTELEKETAELKKRFPKEWEETYQGFLQQNVLGIFPNADEMHKKTAEYDTTIKLRYLLSKEKKK